MLARLLTSIMRRQPATPAPAPGAESGLAAVVTSVLESPHAMLIVAGGLLLTFLAFITVNVAICGFIYLRNSKRGAAEEEEEEERPYRATKASYKPYKPPKRTKPAPKPASSDDASSEDEPAPAPRKPQGKPLPPIAAPIPQGKAPTKGKAKAKETPRGGKELWQAAAQAAKLEVSATASSEEKMASSSDKLLNLWTKTIDNAMEAHQKRNSEIKQLSPQEVRTSARCECWRVRACSGMCTPAHRAFPRAHAPRLPRRLPGPSPPTWIAHVDGAAAGRSEARQHALLDGRGGAPRDGRHCAPRAHPRAGAQGGGARLCRLARAD